MANPFNAAFIKNSLNNLNVKSHVEELLTEQSILAFMEKVADFIDKHDIVVPELTVRVNGIELSLSGKKLEDSDASKKIDEDRQDAEEDKETKPA